MKRLLALLMVFCLLPLTVFAEGTDESDEDMLIEETLEEAPEDDGTIVDEDTGEIFILTEEEQQKLDEFLEEQPEEEEGIDPDSLDLNPNLPGDVLNILLVGVDTRSKNPEEIIGLGDTQIIVSVNTATGEIKMTSILRDTFVPLPGYKNKYKINCAYKFGCNKVKSDDLREKIRSGASLAMRTINRNFEMNLQHFVAINFNGLASIIDALGGIDIELTKGEARYINSYLRKHPPAYDNKAKGERTRLEEVAGTQHLDGVQAVMYARTRSLSGESDFNRTDRQRHLLELLLQKVLTDMDFSTLMDLIDIATSYAATNMNFETLFTLAGSLLPALTQRSSGDPLFTQMRIPGDGTWKNDTVNGQSVIVFKKSAHPSQDLHEFIYGAYYPAK